MRLLEFIAYVSVLLLGGFLIGLGIRDGFDGKLFLGVAVIIIAIWFEWIGQDNG